MDFLEMLKDKPALEMLKYVPDIKKYVDGAVIDSVERYKEAMYYNDILNRLYCATFNNDKRDDFDEVSSVLAELGSKAYQFAKRYKPIKDGIDRSFAKYLLWGYHYSHVSSIDIALYLFKKGYIKKMPYETQGGYINHHYVITGLHYAVGDNVFKTDRNGRGYRTYVKSYAIQCFVIRNEDVRAALDGENVEEVGSEYTRVSVGDGKGCCKISMSRKDKNSVLEYHRKLSERLDNF